MSRMDVGAGSARRFRLDGHAWVRLLLLGACVYFAVHGVRTTLKPYGSDFSIYWKAGRAVLDGGDPYDVFGFIYLPVFAVAMVPFALLPQAAAIVAWQLASFAALVYVLRASVRLVEHDGAPAPRYLAWLPLLFVLRLVDSNFANGQVNLLVFAAVTMGAESWRAAQAARDGRVVSQALVAASRPGVGGPDDERSAYARRHWMLGGQWIGFATALKIVPGFVALHALMRGAWRAVITTVATSLVVVLLAPVPALGWNGNVAGLRRWWHETTAPYVAGGEELLDAREYLPGQSLTACAYRLLSKTPATSRGDEGPSAEWADLPLATTRWIVRGVQVLLLAVIVATIVRSRRVGDERAWTREFALLTCGALLLAPLVHKAHMTWLVVPVTLLVAGSPPGLGRTARTARWALVGLAFVLIALTTPALFGRHLAQTFLSHNAIFFGLACLFAALLVDAWCVAPQGARKSMR